MEQSPVGMESVSKEANAIRDETNQTSSAGECQERMLTKVVLGDVLLWWPWKVVMKMES